MCIAPILLDEGQLVACRKCWQCISNRINDWVGRCIAETRTSAKVYAVTLTYGRAGEAYDRGERVSYGEAEHPRAAVLTYSDVQKYLKVLRKDFGAGSLRYFAIGEYGARKGRAHWHLILFWQRPVEFEPALQTRFNEEHWPHGFSFFEKPGYEHFKYNVKYLCKGMGKDDRQGHSSMSKKPPLGAAYFAARARRIAEEGLAPQGLDYTLREAVKRNGAPVVFRLAGRSAELYLEAYVRAWRALNGAKHHPTSELLDEYADAQARNSMGPLLEPYRQRAAAPTDLIFGDDGVETTWGELQLRSWGLPFEAARLRRDAVGHSWYYETAAGRRLVWSVNEKGLMAWRDLRLEVEASAVRRSMREARQAARQRGEPWNLLPGSRPKRERPAGL